MLERLSAVAALVIFVLTVWSLVRLGDRALLTPLAVASALLAALVPALLLAFGLQIVSIVLPAVSGAPLWNLASAVLYGGTFAGIVSLTLALIGRRYPDNPSKAMARLTLSYGAAQVIAPAMTGAVATATGSYAGALWATAGVMLLGMALLVALRRVEHGA